MRFEQKILLGFFIGIAVSAAVGLSAEPVQSKDAPLRSGPPVGFFLASPQTEGLENTPANVGYSYIFDWQMKSTGDRMYERIVDFTTAEQWLSAAYKTGLQAVPVLEASVQGSQDTLWLQSLWKKSGQNSVDSRGNPMAWASIYSPLYRENVFNYLDQYIDWIKTNDKNRYVPAYAIGGGWVWPYGQFDYHPMTFSAFREWLQSKYSDLPNLNANWGSAFTNWAAVKPPTPVSQIGDVNIGSVTYTFSDPMDFSWVSPSIDVEPGCEYRASVDAYQDGVGEKMSMLQFMFFDDEGKLMHIRAGNSFALKDVDGKWETTSVVMQSPIKEPRAVWVLGEEAFSSKPPPTARTLRLGLRLLGPGTIEFKNPSIKKWPIGEELLCPRSLSLKEAKEKWTLEGYKGQNKVESGIEASTNDAEPVFSIAVAKPPLPYKNTGVAWEDWVNFSHESMAGWLDSVAKRMKKEDTSRDLISYLAFTFGFHNQWEGNNSVMRLDIDLANTPNVDIYGIQLATAGRDFTYATSSIDVARKYGKPVYATDLIDFPYGLYSGFEPIYRASLAVVQHGLGGVFYFAWTAPPMPDYEYRNHLAKIDLDRLVTDTKTAIEAVNQYKLRTKVAMLEPLMSFSLADEGGFKGDQLDSGGLYHLILDMGFIPDIITPYEISKQGSDLLNKYDVVFISDCPVLDNQVNQIVLDYVKGGGAVIGSGRPPMKDLAGLKLKDNLLAEYHPAKNMDAIKAASNPTIQKLGEGKVYWMENRIGHAYWGETRRFGKHGDTVPLFVRTDYSAEAKSLRRYLRRTVSSLVDSTGFKSPARIDASDGTIHLAVYQKLENTSDFLLFLVNTGEGRSMSISVQLDPSVQANECVAWVDFDKKVPIRVDAKGILEVPDFTHSCVITLNSVEK